MIQAKLSLLGWFVNMYKSDVAKKVCTVNASGCV